MTEETDDTVPVDRLTADELMSGYDFEVMRLYADEETGTNENNCRQTYRDAIAVLRTEIMRRMKSHGRYRYRL